MPNHSLRRAVTALAVRNVGTQRNAATGGHDAEDCCGTRAKPRSQDTSRIAWADTYTAITASQVNGGQFFAAVVPEPSTYALLLGGVAAAPIVRGRRGRPLAILPTRGNSR